MRRERGLSLKGRLYGFSHQSLSHRKDRPRGQGLKVTAIRCLYTFRKSGESVDEPAGMGPHPRACVALCLPILLYLFDDVCIHHQISPHSRLILTHNPAQHLSETMNYKYSGLGAYRVCFAVGSPPSPIEHSA